MSTTADFQTKLADIQRAMEREEWAKAIHDLENIGTIPDKFLPVASNILFYLYLSRNQFEKLARISERFDPAKSKDCVSALLLLRDKCLGYSVNLPKGWSIDTWEQAVEVHANAGRLEPKELQLCLHFLSVLNRPRLLQTLHKLAVEAGNDLDNESAEIVLRSYISHKLFAEARRFLWINNLNNLAFERFSFLLDHAEKGLTALPKSNDKFLSFLRYKFGSDFPAEIPTND